LFTGKGKGPSIKEYIKHMKSICPETCKKWLFYNLSDDVVIWWKLLSYEMMKTLSNEA
jgi:hypothetical protein